MKRVIVFLAAVLIHGPVDAQEGQGDYTHLNRREVRLTKHFIRKNPYVLHQTRCYGAEGDMILKVLNMRTAAHPTIEGEYLLLAKALVIAELRKDTGKHAQYEPVQDSIISEYQVDMGATFGYDRKTWWMLSLLKLVDYRTYDQRPCYGTRMLANPDKSQHPEQEAWDRHYYKWIRRHQKKVRKVVPYRHV